MYFSENESDKESFEDLDRYDLLAEIDNKILGLCDNDLKKLLSSFFIIAFPLFV